MTDIEKEIWKDIIGFEGHYQISSWGRIKTLEKYRTSHGVKQFKVPEKIMNPSKVGKKRSYFGTVLSKYGVETAIRLHRITAIHFVPNPLNLPEVNHLDGNTFNNYYKNLEWSTTKDNIAHAWQNKLANAKHREIPVINIQNNIRYNTITEAAKANGLTIGCISNQINNRVNNPVWKKI